MDELNHVQAGGLGKMGELLTVDLVFRGHGKLTILRYPASRFLRFDVVRSNSFSLTLCPMAQHPYTRKALSSQPTPWTGGETSQGVPYIATESESSTSISLSISPETYLIWPKGHLQVCGMRWVACLGTFHNHRLQSSLIRRASGNIMSQCFQVRARIAP